jgi:hypothetical protein
MNRQEVILCLEKAGYKSYPVPRHTSETIVWTGSKRFPSGSLQCDTNEHKISWHVSVYDWYWDNYNKDSGLAKVPVEMQSVELEVVGEKHEQWFSLKSYSISFEQLPNILQNAEDSLFRAWNSIGKE